MSNFRRWLAAVLLAGTLSLPALAQEMRRGVRPEDEVGPGLQTEPTAALPYAVAAITFILVMVLVCAPSRKAHRE
jgi:hypothetical protein